MLELYEQNHTIQASHGSEVDGSTSNLTATHPPKAAASAANEDAASASSRPPAGGGTAADAKHRASAQSPARPLPEQSHGDDQQAPHGQHAGGHPRNAPEALSGVSDHNLDSDARDAHHPHHHRREAAEASSKPGPHAEADWEAATGRCLPDAIKRIDKDKVKAALEKRKQSRGSLPKSAADLIDEDDLIERELESGVELAAKDERTQQETRRSWPRPSASSSQRQGSEDRPGLDKEKVGGGAFEDQQQQQQPQGRQNPRSSDRERGALPDSSVDNAEEGELSSLDLQEPRHRPKPDRVAANGKRQLEVTQQRPDRPHASRDSTRDAWPDHVERDSKRPRHEAHV